MGIDTSETQRELDFGPREMRLNWSNHDSEEVDNAPLPKHQAAHTSNGQLLVSQAWANHAEGILVQMINIELAPLFNEQRHVTQQTKTCDSLQFMVDFASHSLAES